MRNEFRCCECGTLVFLPSTVKTVSCRRCGETYFCNDDKPPRKFYPALSMYPVDTADGAVSKWMPSHTRPIKPGAYDVRFRHTEPHILRAWWNGSRFVTMDGEPRPIVMTQFLAWRGMLA